MGVTITSPKDSIQVRSSKITFTWTAFEGQVAYEFQYKLASSMVGWETLGKVNSTNSSGNKS